MKVLVLLCFVAFACQQAAAMSRAEILSLLQTNYAIDDVLTFLQALKADQSKQITTIDEQYTEEEAKDNSDIENLTDLLNQKTASCDAIDVTVKQGQDQVTSVTEQIQDAQNTIDTNTQNAETAADARCAANLLFISELGDREEAVEFLTYLRGRVADPSFVEYLNQQGGSFLQLKAALGTKQENEILSLIAKHHMLSAIQAKQSYEGETDLSGQLTAGVRTSDEVGTDYQDNSRGALQVQGVGDDSVSAEQVVQQLLGYIDSLIANLQGGIEQLQEVETRAVQAFIEYRRKLKDQSYVAQKFIDAANAQLTDLEAVNNNNQQAAAQCREEVTPLQEQVQQAKDKKTEYESSTAQRRQSLVDTLALLDQVIQVYTNEVVNIASEGEKARADEYLNAQQPAPAAEASS